MTSGNPTGYDESGYWGHVDNARPDALRWLAVDLLSGTIVCDLPTVATWDPTRRTLCKYESITAQLIVTDATSPSWVQASRPFASALIAYRGDPGAEVIYWGGVVLRRQRSVGSNAVTLTLATPECYLDRRYTGAYTTDPSSVGATKDQAQIVADLITSFVADSPGMPITVVQLAGTSFQRYEVYNDYDDKTVYSNLAALSGLLNGPEWTAHWTWDRGANTITPTLYVGNRIGFAVPAGLAPRAVFDSANLITGTLDENYATGQGANVITATSSGQGLARPQATSPLGAPNYDGRPRVEFRFQPATSIEDPLTLQQHADHADGLLTGGTNTVTLKAAVSASPPFGVAWDIGDDVGYVLSGPAFPNDLVGVGRAIGYEADDTYITPTLYVAQPT